MPAPPPGWSGFALLAIRGLVGVLHLALLHELANVDADTTCTCAHIAFEHIPFIEQITAAQFIDRVRRLFFHKKRGKNVDGTYPNG